MCQEKGGSQYSGAQTGTVEPGAWPHEDGEVQSLGSGGARPREHLWVLVRSLGFVFRAVKTQGRLLSKGSSGRAHHRRSPGCHAGHCVLVVQRHLVSAYPIPASDLSASLSRQVQMTRWLLTPRTPHGRWWCEKPHLPGLMAILSWRSGEKGPQGRQASSVFDPILLPGPDS